MKTTHEWITFPAKFDSKCKVCGKSTLQGEKIAGQKDVAADSWVPGTFRCLDCIPADAGILNDPVSTPIPTDAEAEANFESLKAEMKGGKSPDETEEVLADLTKAPKDSLEQFRDNAAWSL